LFWKTTWRFLKKVKLKLLYDPVILILGIYPKGVESGFQRDIGAPMFMAVLLIIANVFKQLICP
jgi:hypothetical protein